MSDKIITATAADNQISITFCNLTETCAEALRLHGLKETAAQALCEFLVATALVSSTMKNDTDIVSLVVRSQGPGKGITAMANKKGEIKGYFHEATATAPTIEELLGPGFLTITKDIGLREPYTGTMSLLSGEIAATLTSYFAESEQIPSSCGIGVELEGDKVKAACGFLIQLMPDTDLETVDALERDLARHPEPAELYLQFGTDYRLIISKILPGFEVTILKEEDIRWHCDCSPEKMAKAVIAIGKEGIEELLEEGQDVEVGCAFCNSKYTFTPEDLGELYERSK